MLRMLCVLGLIAVLLMQGAEVAIARLDNYVVNFLRVRDAVELPLDDEGMMVTVTAEELSEGKRLFERNCINCHVGGATLPNPTVTLSLSDLAGATPPLDTLQGLINFQREPLIYDGSDESYECRIVPEAWMDDVTLQKLAAFVLEAAYVAPGWGRNILEEPF